VKRHIVSQDVMGAWQFEALDVAPLEEATVEAYADGADLPGAPVVEQADDGTPEVWVIDGDLRRHVADPASLAAWKLADQVKKAPAAEVYAHKPGPEWRAKPFVFQGSGPAVYVLDDAPGATGGAGGGAPGDPGATPKGGPSGAVTIVSAPGSSDDGGAVTGSSCAASPGPARESAGAAFLAAAIALVARRRRTNAIGLGVAP
jgi:MYXO-CTERM domain-containing protein